jgi:catechol 2,3-dioxygenase-like lactoylglutathione lyase family enzyme
MSDVKAVWPGPIFAVTVFTDDLPATKEFYTRVFGLPAQWEDADSAVFAFANILINVLVATAAPSSLSPRPSRRRQRELACSSPSTWMTRT